MSASYNHLPATPRRTGSLHEPHYIREVFWTRCWRTCTGDEAQHRERPEKFADYIGSKQSTELQQEILRQEKELAAMRKRKAELDAIFKSNMRTVCWAASQQEQFQMLSGSYTEEQNLITVGIPRRE